MSAGLSWRRLLRRWGAKKQSTGTEENQLPTVEPAPVPVGKIFMEPESDGSLSENAQTVLPTTTQYVMATGKQVLALLQSAASVIPVPLLQEAIGVAVKIIGVCEEASDVQQRVKELRERVSHIMIILVENVTVKYEEGSEAVEKATVGIEKDINDLLSVLKMIDKHLAEVRQQEKWRQGLYRELNMDAVESCSKKLSTILEKFKLANDLRDSNLLLELHARLNKISEKIDHMHRDVKRIANTMDNFLSKSERSATQLPSDTVVRQQRPMKPVIFHGRDDLIEEIAQLLVKKENAHVCLLGPGGMGKTSVSLAVVELHLIKERFPGENCVWVPCIEATSANLLLEILHIQLQIPGDKQVTLQEIISELNASKRPRLILLDNFETPWNAAVAGTQKQIEDILRQLVELSHVAIFITMRGTNPPCHSVIQSKNIQPTNEEASLRIYHENNPDSKDDPDVGSLLKVLGYMPFAVTLMAKLGMEGRSTAGQLLEAWRESGPDILGPDSLPEQSMNRSIALSVESDVVKQDPNAITLLSILSLLPAGTTNENLHWWARDSGLKKSMIPSAISALSKTTLLAEDKRQTSVLFVVPVVQSFMQQHDRIEEKIRKQIQASCCQYILDHACRYDEPTFPVKSKALAAEDTNIQSIFFCSPHVIPSDTTMEALIAFNWHRCDTKPDLNIAKHAVMAAEASGVKRFIASAEWCLGRTHYQLGSLSLSYSHLQTAYELFNTFPPDEIKFQRLGVQCGNDLVDAAHFVLQDKREVVSLARGVEAKCADLSDDILLCRSLVLLGVALEAAREPEEALTHLNRARAILKDVGNSLSLAYACQVISRAHYYESRLQEALDAIEEAWKFAESTDNPFIQANISLQFGMILFSTDRDTEAWEHMERALMKASHVGNRFTLARVLQYRGYGYLRRGDYEAAYVAYETAAQNFLVTTQAQCEKKCKDNMARIRQKQENPGMTIMFRRPCADPNRSLFSVAVQTSASDGSSVFAENLRPEFGRISDHSLDYDDWCGGIS